ncbi:MAG: PAS domain S-box protein, partial [Elusimicrobia bacterium]|nr:PAS domain S-box protein [Elusimicrobiota bacterium]
MLCFNCYARYIVNTDIVFSHLYYIPIVTGCLSAGFKFLPWSVLLAASLPLSRVFADISGAPIYDAGRAAVMIMVAVITALLSEKIKREELKTAEERRRFKNTSDFIPIALCEFGLDGKLFYGNKLFTGSFCQPGKNCAGRGVFDFFSPSDSLKFREHIGTLIREKKIKTEDFLMLRKNGKTVNVSISSSLITGSDQTVRGIRSVIADKTERLECERRIRERDSFWQSLFDRSPLGMVLIDEQTHNIVKANSAALKMFGKPLELVKGQVCGKYICPPGNGQYPISDLGQEVNSCECVLISASGARIPIIKTAVSLMFEGKKYLLETFADIIELDAARSEIKRERDLFRNYMDVASSIVVVLSTAGKIVLINKKGCEILEISQDNAIGKDWFDFIPEDTREKARETIINGKKEAVEFYENDVITPGGKRKTIIWSNGVLRDEYGEITASVSSGLDVTLLRKTENEKRKLQESFIFHERLASVGRIAAGAAHEINNPLTGIIAFADLLLSEKANITAVMGKNLEVIKSSSLRIKKIVSDLLSFSAKTASPAKKEKTDINRIVEEAVSELQKNFKKNKIEMIFSPGKIPDVSVVPAEIFRSVKAMLENSIDAVKEKKQKNFKPRIEIKTARFSEKSEAAVIIRDNGTGI